MVENCLINFLCQAILQCTNSNITLTATELPVFVPNEYFYKHHQKEGEEQWETYMRVFRQIISDGLNRPLSESSVEDKYEYRKFLNPKPKGFKHTD